MEWINNTLENVLNSSIIFSYFIVYLAGVLTSFTPCIYPMIPVTVGIIGGIQNKSKLKGFIMSLTYVAGISITYSTLGIIAAMSGSFFGGISSNPWVLLFVANIIILFALAMLDVYTIPLPGFLTKIRIKSEIGGITGVFLMGVVSGFVAAPCTSPVLGVLLTYVAVNRSPVIGGSLLFVFAFGMGTLLIFIGTFTSVLVSLPRSGTWMIVVKKAMGFLLLFVGEYFLIQAGKYFL